jgi:ParB-like chromosome segregation protein Spo0J
MDFHEAANIFPLDEEHIGDLAKDIRQHGLQVPIERLDGKIIDGRRRYLACERAGVQPKFRDVGVSDPIAYVLSLNLQRRHLTTSQLSMCAARARKLYDQRAKERQKVRKGKQAGSTVENLPQLKDAGKARDEVGKAFGVSGRTVDYATKVLEDGVPELIQAVDEGRMSASTAAILTTEEEEVQRERAASPNHRRKYGSGPFATRTKEPVREREPEEEKPEGELRGVGVIRANEAINSLTRIPKNDPLRQSGLQLVKDWIRRNQ